MDQENLRTRRASPILWQGGMRRFAMKVFTTFYRRMYFLVRPLDATIPDLHPRVSVDIKMLTKDDLAAYNRFRPDQCANLIQDSLARGDQYFAAWHEERIVHAIRVTTGQVYVPYLRRDLILQPDDIYSHNSFTLPAFRGYGLSPARGAHVMRHYRQKGYKRMVALVVVEDKTALRAAQKMGYQSVGLYSCLRFGPWQRDSQQTWSEEPLPRLVRVA